MPGLFPPRSRATPPPRPSRRPRRRALHAVTWRAAPPPPLQTIVPNLSAMPNGIAYNGGSLFIASLDPYKSCTIYRLDNVDQYALEKRAASLADLVVVRADLPFDFWHGWKVRVWGVASGCKFNGLGAHRAGADAGRQSRAMLSFVIACMPRWGAPTQPLQPPSSSPSLPTCPAAPPPPPPPAVHPLRPRRQPVHPHRRQLQRLPPGRLPAKQRLH